MTVREIQAFLAEMYAVEVSPDLDLKTRGCQDILIVVTGRLCAGPWERSF
jgi:transposase-like protein